MFLAMGFTGREAARFKEMFVLEFRRMREVLEGRAPRRGNRSGLPNGVARVEAAEWAAFLAAWRSERGERLLSVPDLLALAERRGLLLKLFAKSANEMGRMCSLGRALSALSRLPVDGVRIERVRNRAKTHLYRIAPQEALPL